MLWGCSLDIQYLVLRCLREIIHSIIGRNMDLGQLLSNFKDLHLLNMVLVLRSLPIQMLCLDLEGFKWLEMVSELTLTTIEILFVEINKVSRTKIANSSCQKYGLTYI